jgi:hypothetical protein
VKPRRFAFGTQSFGGSFDLLALASTPANS